jgi:hypothetical protein
MRSKLLVAILLLLAAFFVVSDKTASACSFGSYGSEEVLITGKYKLVNLNTHPKDLGIDPKLKKYPKSGLYTDDGTDMLIWEAPNLPVIAGEQFYISNDGKYLVIRSGSFLPQGLFFFKEGQLLAQHPISFFKYDYRSQSTPTSMCDHRWFFGERFDGANRKFHLIAWNEDTYIFDLETGAHLETVVAPKKEEPGFDFLMLLGSSAFWLVGAIVVLLILSLKSGVKFFRP